MVQAAWACAGDADVGLAIHDAGRREISEETRQGIEGLAKASCEKVLVLNKIDLFKREKLLVRAASLSGLGKFSKVFMLSALSGDGTEDLIAYLAGRMPEGPWLFPEDQLSDLSVRMLAAEITREKLFLNRAWPRTGAAGALARASSPKAARPRPARHQCPVGYPQLAGCPEMAARRARGRRCRSI